MFYSSLSHHIVRQILIKKMFESFTLVTRFGRKSLITTDLVDPVKSWRTRRSMASRSHCFSLVMMGNLCPVLICGPGTLLNGSMHPDYMCTYMDACIPLAMHDN
jgi:hypothetical protein